jgi:hypothetical protein
VDHSDDPMDTIAASTVTSTTRLLWLIPGSASEDECNRRLRTQELQNPHERDNCPTKGYQDNTLLSPSCGRSCVTTLYVVAQSDCVSRNIRRDPRLLYRMKPSVTTIELVI